MVDDHVEGDVGGAGKECTGDGASDAHGETVDCALAVGGAYSDGQESAEEVAGGDSAACDGVVAADAEW